MTSAPVTHPEASQNRLGDLWGGLAAMLVALPSSIAFGVTACTVLGTEGMAQGAVAGIVGAIAIGLVAPLVGGTPRLISAPCAPAAAVLAALAADLLGGTPGEAPEKVLLLLTLVGLISGVLQLVYGMGGGGRLIKYIPYPVVSGYLSGVAALIFLSQLPKLFGMPEDVPLIQGLLSPALWQWPSVLVGAVTILVIALAPRFTKAVPATIIGLLAGTLTYLGLGVLRPELLHLENNKLLIGAVSGTVGSLLGETGHRWQALRALHLNELSSLLAPAFTLSIVLSMDTLKTCVVLDALTRSRHNSNRELVGQGVANIASALAGGMAGAGTMGATLVNLNSGARTRASGMVEGALAAVAFLALSPLIGWTPIAALAGLLIMVAFRMFDRSSLHLLRQRSTLLDFLVIAAVIVVAVRASLIAAAGAGLALAILLFIREQMRGAVIRRKAYGSEMSSKQHRLPSEKEVLLNSGAATTICELQGSLFFGTTDRLFSELERDLKTSRYVILDMRRVQSVDFTAAHLLDQIGAMLAERNARLLLSGLPASLPTGQDLEAYFHEIGLVKPDQSVRVFPALDDALAWAEDRLIEDAQLHNSQNESLLDLAEIELLRELEEDQILAALRPCAREVSYVAGQPIFSKGDASDDLFLIRRGAVRVFLPMDHGRYLNLATFGRGSFFGDMAFLDRGVRSADAVAVTATEVYAISRARFNEAAHQHPLLGVKVFARLARALAIRLRHTDNELRALQEA